LLQGFTVGQVVHGYGDVCQSVTDLAMETSAPISTDDFRTLNRCLDDAIAGAVTQYGLEHDQSIDGEAAGETARVEAMARELRTSIQRASVALGAIKSGHVGIAGSTGTVLDQSLLNAQDLSDRLLPTFHESVTRIVTRLGRRSALGKRVVGGQIVPVVQAKAIHGPTHTSMRLSLTRVGAFEHSAHGGVADTRAAQLRPEDLDVRASR
jgi:hypothetical protein